MTLEDTHTEMVAVPVDNGTKTLPRRAGTRTMIPTTWIDRTLRVEYVGAGGEAREMTCTFLDWTPVGLLLNIAGAKTLLAWERLVMCELIED